MCTLAAKKLNGMFFLFKNRDLSEPAHTVVVHENDVVKKVLIVDEHGHCEGLNEYGIGMIDATLKPYPLVPYPDSSLYAREVLNQSTIEDAISVIKRNLGSVNTIIADAHRAYVIEKTPYEFAITEIETGGVITNTSIVLDKRNGPHSEESRIASETRLNRGKQLLPMVHSMNDIQRFLGDTEGFPLFSICRGADSIAPTRCAFIYDLAKKTVYFCDTSPDVGLFQAYSIG